MPVTAVALGPPVCKHRGELARIPEPEVDALPREGVHIMRGVTYEGKARAREFRHAQQSQRKPRRGRDGIERADDAAARRFDLGGELAGGLVEQLPAPLLADRPHHGNVISRHGQKRQDAVPAEPLERDALVRLLAGEIGDDAELTVVARGSGDSRRGPHARLGAELKLVIDLARRMRLGAGTAAEDPWVRQQLARFATEVTNLRLNAYRNVATIERTGHPGPQGSTQKLGWSELDQRIKEFASRLLGPAGLLLPGDDSAVDAGLWAHELLWSRAGTIYAGTSEIQRNILAQRVLGLPRA